jgi:dihydrodipicolinate synthase/N-acetylneuraminate lyase
MRTIKEGDVKAARDAQWRINELRGNLQKPPLASHYEALRLRGVDAGVPRAPLRGMTEAEREDLKKRLDALGVL